MVSFLANDCECVSTVATAPVDSVDSRYHLPLSWPMCEAFQAHILCKILLRSSLPAARQLAVHFLWAFPVWRSRKNWSLQCQEVTFTCTCTIKWRKQMAKEMTKNLRSNTQQVIGRTTWRSKFLTAQSSPTDHFFGRRGSLFLEIQKKGFQTKTTGSDLCLEAPLRCRCSRDQTKIAILHIKALPNRALWKHKWPSTVGEFSGDRQSQVRIASEPFRTLRCPKRCNPMIPYVSLCILFILILLCDSTCSL